MPEKLLLVPDQQSYRFDRDRGMLGSDFAGGLSRQRLDTDNPAGRLRVRWTIGPEDYQYLNAFYNLYTKKGSLPFLMDLLLNQPELEEHTVQIVGNSYQLESVEGLTYSVTADIEVVPKNDPIADEAVIAFYEAGGVTDGFFLALEQLTNYDIDVN